MSHPPDDPSSDRVSPVSMPAPPAASGESADPQAEMVVSGDPPKRARRRWRRRPPREAGAVPQPAEFSVKPQGEGDRSRGRRRRRHRGARPDTGTAETARGEEIPVAEGPLADGQGSAAQGASPAAGEGGLGVSASRDGKVHT